MSAIQTSHPECIIILEGYQGILQQRIMKLHIYLQKANNQNQQQQQQQQQRPKTVAINFTTLNFNSKMQMQALFQKLIY